MKDKIVIDVGRIMDEIFEAARGFGDLFEGEFHPGHGPGHSSGPGPDRGPGQKSRQREPNFGSGFGHGPGQKHPFRGAPKGTSKEAEKFFRWDEQVDYYPTYSYPPMNIYLKNDNSLVFEFALAGFREEDINLEFQGDYMVFSAENPGSGRPGAYKASRRANDTADETAKTSGAANETSAAGHNADSAADHNADHTNSTASAPHHSSDADSAADHSNSTNPYDDTYDDEENIRYFKRRLKFKEIDNQKYYVPEDKFKQEHTKAVFKNGILKVTIPPTEVMETKEGIKVEIINEEDE